MHPSFSTALSSIVCSQPSSFYQFISSYSLPKITFWSSISSTETACVACLPSLQKPSVHCLNLCCEFQLIIQHPFYLRVRGRVERTSTGTLLLVEYVNRMSLQPWRNLLVCSKFAPSFFLVHGEFHYCNVYTRVLVKNDPSQNEYKKTLVRRIFEK